ncbi:MAG: DUF2867 domain-containing protein [Haloechinothrix sp.]
MPQVTQVPIPPRARELAGLRRVDYADAFAIDVEAQHSPAEWIRVAAAASPAVFTAVRLAHQALGLHLEPTGAPDHPIGWDVLHDEAEEAVLGNHGVLGVPRIVGLTPPGQIVVATLIQFNGLAGRALWLAFAPGHRAVARHALGRMATFELASD